MKKLLILLSATLLGNTLHAQFLRPVEATNHKDIKGVAKQFFAHNPFLAGSLPDVAKLAHDRFLIEVEAAALVVNS